MEDLWIVRTALLTRTGRGTYVVRHGVEVVRLIEAELRYGGSWKNAGTGTGTGVVRVEYVEKGREGTLLLHGYFIHKYDLLSRYYRLVGSVVEEEVW